MRAILIMLGLVLVMAVGGFFYLLHVADQMAPEGGENRIELDLDLPR